jgi:hypothetical protein
MSKKAVTWMDVIREQLAKLRKEGKTPSIGDVTPYAKKEWADIKAGKHPLYSQGTSKGKGTSKGSSKKGKMNRNKTVKLSKQSSSKRSSSKRSSSKQSSKMVTGNSTMSIQQMLSKVHLCKKDMGKIQKYLKSQRGGGCGCEQTGGDCGCDKMSGGKQSGGKQSGGKQSGGKQKSKIKKTKKTKKTKKMKGGDSDADDTKESFVEDVDPSTGLLASSEAEEVETQDVEEV